ncbi:MAG: hypothetical protein LBQ66_04340 [Planctomycetaceae bacterium]|jgi:hypothetical protein|nr:hypothetical protein [Planctomycetaceae bacterium]
MALHGIHGKSGCCGCGEEGQCVSKLLVSGTSGGTSLESYKRVSRMYANKIWTIIHRNISSSSDMSDWSISSTGNIDANGNLVNLPDGLLSSAYRLYVECDKCVARDIAYLEVPANTTEFIWELSQYSQLVENDNPRTAYRIISSYRQSPPYTSYASWKISKNGRFEIDSSEYPQKFYYQAYCPQEGLKPIDHFEGFCSSRYYVSVYVPISCGSTENDAHDTGKIIDSLNRPQGDINYINHDGCYLSNYMAESIKDSWRNNYGINKFLYRITITYEDTADYGTHSHTTFSTIDFFPSYIGIFDVRIHFTKENNDYGVVGYEYSCHFVFESEDKTVCGWMLFTTVPHSPISFKLKSLNIEIYPDCRP